MKVKTLMAAILHEIDEVEIFIGHDRISKCSPDTLWAAYGDERVKKFWIREDDDGLKILQVVLR